VEKKVVFSTGSGTKLSGVIHHPDAGTPRAYALFAHCFTCTKNIRAAINISEALCQEGIAVLRFDFTGLGQSEGDFANTHFSSNVQDLIDAARFLEEDYRAPKIIVGHSLGGTAILAAAHRIQSAVAVATIGSPANADHVLHLLEDDLETIEQQGKATVMLAGRPFQVRSEFVQDVLSQSVQDGVRGLRKALLVMHSPVDEIVPVEEAARIYNSALHPKSFISLDGADHMLNKKVDSQFVGRMLSAWASRFIDDPDDRLEHSVFHTGHVVVSGKPEDIFRVSINADGHYLKGDEPEEFGGADTGPSPYDLLSASLAACTVMTLNMYARLKQLDLESVRVDVHHGKIHAQDCSNCDSKSAKIDRLTRILHLKGDLTSEQRLRLLEIAERCPVHKTLHSEIDVETKLAD
jgi:uncharacterized OsmC-like protein/alpha/beta superfamily hydrolase